MNKKSIIEIIIIIVLIIILGIIIGLFISEKNSNIPYIGKSGGFPMKENKEKETLDELRKQGVKLWTFLEF